MRDYVHLTLKQKVRNQLRQKQPKCLQQIPRYLVKYRKCLSFCLAFCARIVKHCGTVLLSRKKCPKPQWDSTHNVLLRGAEKVLSGKKIRMSQISVKQHITPRKLQRLPPTRLLVMSMRWKRLKGCCQLQHLVCPRILPVS